MESSPDLDNSVKDSLPHKSKFFKNGDLQHSKVRADILDLGGGASNEKFSKLRGVAPKKPISIHSLLTVITLDRLQSHGLVETIKTQNVTHLT